MNNGINSLDGKAVVFVRMSISGMAMARTDRDLTSMAEKDTGAEHGAVKTSVCKIPPSFSEPIIKAGSAIRNYLKAEAVQIGDVYAVPISQYARVSHELNKRMQEYRLFASELVKAARSGLLEEILQAKLGSAFKGDKIPSADMIEARFTVNAIYYNDLSSVDCQKALSVLADDVRDTLTRDVQAGVKIANELAVKEANEFLLTEIRELVDDIQARCGRDDVKGTQYKTLVDKIQRIVTVCPSYNITNNPTISKLIGEIETCFGHFKSTLLKDDEAVRKNAVVEAKKIEQSYANLF